MHHTHALVLLSTLFTSLNSASASDLPRGVGPEFAKFYESLDRFTCIGHPYIKLKPDQINDNSCDCPDGSDEPGTAACANLDALSPPQPLPGSPSGTTNTSHALPGFWCQNEGHVGAYLPFMYVNDGVCDQDLCCDGSEEFGNVGGVKCKNKCAEIGKEWKRKETARRASIERSVQKRKTLAKESRQARKTVEAKLGRLRLDLKDLEFKKNALQKKLEEVEREEAGKVAQTDGQQSKLGILLGLAKRRVNDLRDALDQMVTQRDDYKDKVAELEDILKLLKSEYNPNFNDEGVKQAVKAWEDYAATLGEDPIPEPADVYVLELLKADDEYSGINWKDFEDDESDTDILYNLEAYLPGPIRDFVREKLNDLHMWLIENGMVADKVRPGSESKLVTAAKEAVRQADHEHQQKQVELNDAQNDLEKDYGPDDIFRSLKGKCISVDEGEYEYELCWMENTTQKSKKGHGNTGMGNYVRVDREMVDEEDREDGKGLGSGERMVLKFENGQGCWNGPARSTHVWLACAEKEELWRVSETEKCTYKMEVGTPLACEETMEPPKGKDEL